MVKKWLIYVYIHIICVSVARLLLEIIKANVRKCGSRNRKNALRKRSSTSAFFTQLTYSHVFDIA
jgi:hypothetical protein